MKGESPILISWHFSKGGGGFATEGGKDTWLSHCLWGQHVEGGVTNISLICHFSQLNKWLILWHFSNIHVSSEWV